MLHHPQWQRAAPCSLHSNHSADVDWQSDTSTGSGLAYMMLMVTLFFLTCFFVQSATELSMLLSKRPWAEPMQYEKSLPQCLSASTSFYFILFCF